MALLQSDTMCSAEPYRGRIWRTFSLSADEVARFPNWLTSPAPDRVKRPTPWPTLALLLLVTLAPRALMAWRIPSINSDGALYVAAAKAWSDPGGVSYRSNIYPPILAGLHACGLSWETAGKLWGVFCATLVVLPLYGWVRRQFDDRVALVSCLLYAAHPELIEWSPELIRDQTFWLLFATSLYLSWRAVVEVRWRFFLSASVVIPLAACCRFEGLFLLIPAASWSRTRFRSLTVGRRKLVAGVMLAAAIPAATFFGFNCVWRGGEPLNRFFYVEPLERAGLWLRNLAPDAEPSEIEAQRPTAERSPPLGKLTWSVLRVMERGITPFYGLLLLGGLFQFFRLFMRSDHRPTVVLGLAVTTGVWIHLWYCGLASSRYSLSIVILSSRCMAMCLMHLSHGCVTRITSSDAKSRLRLAVAVGPLAALTVVGWIDALTTTYADREANARLGRWIGEQCGEHCVIAGNNEQLAIVGYYAEAQGTAVHLSAVPPDRFAEAVRTVDADVVVVAHRTPDDADRQALLSGGRRLLLDPSDAAAIAPSREPVFVFARPATRR